MTGTWNNTLRVICTLCAAEENSPMERGVRVESLLRLTANILTEFRRE